MIITDVRKGFRMRKAIQKDEEERWIETQNIIVAVLIIFFIVGIVLAYYNLLYNERRDSIIKNGESTAIKTSDRFNEYLSTSSDVVLLTAYTLNDMIKEDRSDKEILDYLVSQSTSIKNSILENSEGLYGYINGRFFSGVLWKPDNHYVATERPWYIKAAANGRNLTMIEPYIDAKSGTVMITIAKLLDDDKSVIAMDVSLEQIQRITEDAVIAGNSDIEIILDGTNTVIAHSNKDEVGKTYREGTGDFAAALVAEINNSDSNFYEFDYENDHYIAYSAMLSNDWRCLSIRNATTVLKPLNMILGSTIVIVFIMVIVLTMVFRKSNERSVIAERLNKQLSSTAEIYRSVHDLDIQNDSFSRILARNGKLTEVIGNDLPDAQKVLFERVDELTDPVSRAEMHDFVDFSTIDERMRDRKTISVEFLSSSKEWLRGRFVVSQTDSSGKITHVLWMVEDINKEKMEREALLDRSERAIAANEAKSAFLSNMSHEIRTPINAVLGMNEMILRESDEQNVIAYSQSIKTAGNTLLGIVNDILDFSKIEAGKMEIIPVDYDLSSMLSDLVNMIQTRADDKGLVLNLDFDPKTPKSLNGDEVRIKQIITNILTNAVKYTERGNILFCVSHEIDKDDPDSVYLCVSVKDTGIGIKPEDIKRLFSEFERIDEKRNRKVEGTGLGMTITKSLLEMMDSHLEVESVYGVGSRFGFRLKQKVLRWEELGSYETSYREYIGSHSKYSEKFTAPDADILVVDDNPMNLMVLQSLLKQTQVRIDTADSGDKALSMTFGKKYDIILLDHMMPEKDGIETLHEMRSRDNDPNDDTPVICLTANAISGAREQYIAEGFDDYLTKPVDSAKLEDMIMRYLPADKILEGSYDESELSEEYEGIIPDKVRENPEIDIETGIKNNGSERTYLETLKLYAREAYSYTDEIERYMASGDVKNATVKIHALKSTSRTIGAVAIGELAQKLEDAGKKNDIATLNDELGGLLDRCRYLGDKLSELLLEDMEDKGEAGDRVIVDDDKLKDAYSRILQFAKECDNASINEVLEELKGYTIPDNEKERFKDLVSALDYFDFDRIIELLR